MASAPVLPVRKKAEIVAKTLISSKFTRDIAAEFGISASALNVWMRNLGLRRNQTLTQEGLRLRNVLSLGKREEALKEIEDLFLTIRTKNNHPEPVKSTVSEREKELERRLALATRIRERAEQISKSEFGMLKGLLQDLPEEELHQLFYETIVYRVVRNAMTELGIENGLDLQDGSEAA